MDSATHDLVYQRISELVYDEEKIVTPVSIASESKISTKDAVTLLKEFIDAHNTSKSGPLAVTYLLYGRLKDGKGITLSLVKDEDLKDKKSLFDEISTETIYSVQTGKEIDFKMIALTNSNCENRNSVFVSRNSVKRNMKVKKLPEIPTNTVKPNVVTSVPSSSITDSTKTNGVANGKQTQSQKSKKNGLASFFAKAPPKAQSSVKADSKTVEKTNVDKVIKSETVKDEDKITNNPVENKKSPKKVEEKPSSQMKDKKTDLEKSTKQSEQTNNKKRKKESTNKGPNKKRKRIQQICDSDSDDIFDDDENEDIIEMSDEEPPPPPPRVASPPAPKNKKRKAVDKTYEDEEGFIVTTTEYVYETASEDEEPAKVAKSEEKVLSEKKNVKQSLPVEAKPAGKGKGNKKAVANGKQPTLMSFFKRN